jgi:hypothetical protein
MSLAEQRRLTMLNNLSPDEKRLIKYSKIGNLKCVKTLLQQGVDIHAGNDYSLQLSSYEGHLDIVEYLVKNGARGKDLALQKSAQKGHYDVVKYLVNNGADIHTNNDYSVKTSAKKGYLKIVKYLVEKGADIHSDNDYVLKILTQQGHLDFIQSLNKKPLQNVSSTCNINNITEKNIQEIGKLIGLHESSKENLCKGIADYFTEMQKKMELNVNKCITEETLTGDPIGDIHPLFFTMYEQGNHIHCGDIRELIRLTKNPFTNVVFTPEQLDLFKNKIKILQSFIENLNDPEEIITNIHSLINNATSKFISRLRYPKSQSLYVNASMQKLDTFIMELSRVNILNTNDVISLNTITDDSTKKITLANVLDNKLKNTSWVEQIDFALEEIYNQVF